MRANLAVNLGNIVLSLSDALDLAFSSLAMHQQRTAYTVWELGQRAELAPRRIQDLFLAALLHDIGALALEDKKSLHDNETMDVETHCVRGERFFRSNPWLVSGAVSVRHHHTPWSAWDGRKDTPEAFDSQLLYLGDVLERSIERRVFILHQEEGLRDRIRSMGGVEIAPEVVDLFLEVSRREEFWLNLTSSRLYSLLLHHGPFRTVQIDIATIRLYAGLLGMVVDFKSPFTSTHSSGVARCSALLASAMGMSEEETAMMETAGLLHDLGKLTVPNSILEKTAALTPAEFAVIKQHAFYTHSVLDTIDGLQPIAEWAAFHHERLTGDGYPFKREGRGLNLGARILAVADVFTALAEDRPYRRGMDAGSIVSILRDQSGSGMLDSRVVDGLLDGLPDIRRDVTAAQEDARESYRAKLSLI